MNDFVLCLGGSFNPIHSKHIQMFIEARKMLENKFHKCSIKGIFVPAEQDYINQKLGAKAISFEERCNLIRIMINETNQSDWITVASEPNAISIDGARKHINTTGKTIVELVGMDRCKRRNDGIVRIYFNRQGSDVPSWVNDEYYIIMSDSDDNISSTRIRNQPLSDSVKQGLITETMAKELNKLWK